MLNAARPITRGLICVIDDDEELRGSLDSLFRSAKFEVRTFEEPNAYLACGVAANAACLVLDIHFRGIDGLDFHRCLRERNVRVPVVLITGRGDIPMTVRAMKAGASNFLTKPFADHDILMAVEEAVECDRRQRSDAQTELEIRSRYGSLTLRERQVMALVTSGLMNKQVAGRLGISLVTVKIHRGNLMDKMKAKSFADLVRMAGTLGAPDESILR